MLPLRRLLYFAHSKRNNFLPSCLLLPHLNSTFHCCCAHVSQMKAMPHSVGNAERMRDWHSFITVKCVGGRLVRKEMSCYSVMTMLVREHLWQHQRASNYNQFPLQTASKTLQSSNKRGCQQSRLSLRWQPCVDGPGERAFVPSTVAISGSLC